MKYFQSDPSYLLVVLKQAHDEAPKLDSGEDLCSLGETVALLKEALKTGGSASDESRPNKPSKDPLAEVDMRNANYTQTKKAGSTTVEDELLDLCDKLLSLIANKARDGIKDFPAQELRRLLSVYSLLPFQADSLIYDIDAEVISRLPGSDTPSSILVEEVLQDAKEKSESVQRELFHETDEPALKALKNGLMSLFRSNDENGSPEETSLPSALATLIQESINSTVEASAALQEMQETLHVSIDSIGQQSSEGTYFELGRCQELIANYRRIEFSTGARRSRYDESRKDMAKRVLSRLLPQQP